MATRAVRFSRRGGGEFPGLYSVSWADTAEVIGVVERVSSTRWVARVNGGHRRMDHMTRAAAGAWLAMVVPNGVTS